MPCIQDAVQDRYLRSALQDKYAVYKEEEIYSVAHLGMNNNNENLTWGWDKGCPSSYTKMQDVDDDDLDDPSVTETGVYVIFEDTFPYNW